MLKRAPRSTHSPMHKPHCTSVRQDQCIFQCTDPMHNKPHSSRALGPPSPWANLSESSPPAPLPPAAPPPPPAPPATCCCLLLLLLLLAAAAAWCCWLLAAVAAATAAATTTTTTTTTCGAWVLRAAAQLDVGKSAAALKNPGGVTVCNSIALTHPACDLASQRSRSFNGSSSR